MELKHLRSFVAVVRYGSFTRAAEKLYLSQPAVSAHVQALEEELGRRLIIRTTKSLEVTPKGQTVCRLAGSILELQRQIVEQCGRGSRTVIRLGASTIPSAYVLPQLLPEFGRLYPEVYFTVHQSNSQGVADGLAEGLFDVGLLGMAGDERLAYIPFCRDRIVLIQGKSLPDKMEVRRRAAVPAAAVDIDDQIVPLGGRGGVVQEILRPVPPLELPGPDRPFDLQQWQEQSAIAQVFPQRILHRRSSFSALLNQVYHGGTGKATWAKCNL